MLFSLNIRNYEMKAERGRCPKAPDNPQARDPCWPRLGIVWSPRSPSPTRFRPFLFLMLRNFLLYNTPDPPRSVYRSFDVFLFRSVSASICFQFRSIMAPANDDEGQSAAGSRKRKSILVGAINTRRAFSHNMQGPIPPALDLDPFPTAEEAIRVTDEFCDKTGVNSSWSWQS